MLPKNYMRQKTAKQEDAIISLLAIRRFRYNRIPIISPGYTVTFPANYQKEAAWLDLPHYQHYISGRYMPPIEAKPVEEQVLNPIFGVEFGIFAT